MKGVFFGGGEAEGEMIASLYLVYSFVVFISIQLLKKFMVKKVFPSSHYLNYSLAK